MRPSVLALLLAALASASCGGGRTETIEPVAAVEVSSTDRQAPVMAPPAFPACCADEVPAPAAR